MASKVSGSAQISPNRPKGVVPDASSGAPRPPRHWSAELTVRHVCSHLFNWVDVAAFVGFAAYTCLYFCFMILQKIRAWLFRLFRPAIELCIVASVQVPRSPPIRPCLPPWMSNPLFKEGTVGCDEAACFPYLSFLNFL